MRISILDSMLPSTPVGPWSLLELSPRDTQKIIELIFLLKKGMTQTFIFQLFDRILVSQRSAGFDAVRQ